MGEMIIDAFAGGGGASVGIEMALGRPVDIAVNHDPDAILMHKTNHPNTVHLTEDIFKPNTITSQINSLKSIIRQLPVQDLILLKKHIITRK